MKIAGRPDDTEFILIELDRPLKKHDSEEKENDD